MACATRNAPDSINRNRQNIEYLPGYQLHDKLEATGSLARAVEGVDVLFVAVPSSSFRQGGTQELAAHVTTDALVISLTKGIEPGGFRLMSEILGRNAANPRGVLSGPNLAGRSPPAISPDRLLPVTARKSIRASTTCCTTSPS